MDLRKEFTEILKEYGHTVLLQRRTQSHEKGAYRDIEGGRYVPQVEQWTSFRWYPGSSTGIPGGVSGQRPEGLVDDCDAAFAFEPRSKIKSGDLVAEPTPEEMFKRDTYRIQDAVPYYLGAQLIYYIAKCEKLTPNR